MPEEIRTEVWRNFIDVWKKLSSPGRPTPKEVAIIEGHIRPLLSKNRGSKVLVLGSTPELRDMLAKYKNAQVVIADINVEMTLAMTSLMKKPNSKEIWIKANWLDLPLPDNYFDAIVGDFVIENVPQEFHRKFFDNILGWLKPKGIFAVRAYVYQPDWKHMTLKEVFDTHSKGPINARLWSSFWDAGIFNTVPGNHSKIVRTDDFLEKIKKIDLPPRIKQILKLSANLYPPGKSWFVYSVSDLEKILLEYFKIAAKKHDLDISLPKPYRDSAPVYKLIKQ